MTMYRVKHPSIEFTLEKHPTHIHTQNGNGQGEALVLPVGGSNCLNLSLRSGLRRGVLQSRLDLEGTNAKLISIWDS